jgi:hypothetical protein
MPIINGKRVNIPDSGVYGEDLKKAAGVKNGRRAVVQKGIEIETIQSGKKYSKRDLIDKKGNPVKISTIPDRTKGIDYYGNRSTLSKKIITEQVYDLAEYLFKGGLDFDEENADWMVVPRFVLPKIWHNISQTSPLLITFPTLYPQLPPVGFYLKADLATSADGHLYAQAYHEADKEPLNNKWKWYCVYVNPGAWSPARIKNAYDWKYGDNLWDYFRLITEALSTRGA